VHHLGSGPTNLLILGGQHGGPESNTIDLVEQLLAYFSDRPSALPSSISLDIMPVANPDGAATDSRQFLSGVDPNRNWGSSDWMPDTFDSNGHFVVGLGGPVPFSEQETRALRDWALQSRPALIVNFHSAGGFMFGARGGRNGDLSEAYADASGYYLPVSGGGTRMLGYRTSGTMASWQRDRGFQGIFVELTSPSDPEFDRNLAGLQAVLGLLAI